MDTKAKKENEVIKDPVESRDFYLNEEAKNWDFSDYVRVTASPRGMVLSFGKFIREDQKYGIFKEIILPYDVADSLIRIVQKQFNQLIDDGLLKEMDDSGDK
jgi:hypothetical protein